MVTENLFKMSKCRIEDCSVIVDGRRFAIESIEEEDDYKTLVYVVFWGMGITLILSIIYSIFIVIPEILRDKDGSYIISSLFTLISALSIFAYGMFVVYRRRVYKTRWKVNGSKYIYLEESDSIDDYNNMKQLEKRVCELTSKPYR